MLFSLPAPAPSAPDVGIWWGSGLATIRDPDCLWWATCAIASNGSDLSFHLPLRVLAATSPHSLDSSSVVATHIPVWSCNVRPTVLEHSLSSVWGVHRGSCRKPVSRSHSGFNRPFLPCFGSWWAFMHSSGAASSFPQPSCSLTSPSSSQGGSSSHCRTPGLGHPISYSNHSLSREGLHPCNLSSPVPRGTGPDLIPSIPLLPNSACIFLIAVFIWESFC